VAAPSVASSPLKIATSAEGDTKCNEVIIPVEQQDASVAEPSAASSLLKVVTLDGNNTLHLLAANGANGDSQKFESCAKFIHNQGKSWLYKKDNKGDTPLHCAVRAGKSQLVVSCLTDLAKVDGKVQDLLRMLNNNNETVLHEAVRRGDKVVVEKLMKADPELASSFPTNGVSVVSPLYVAIQLINDTTILQKEEIDEDKADQSLRKEKNNDLSRQNEEKSMAQTLHDESKDGFLSYLGSNGQNALHAAVLRGPGTHEEACMRSFLAS
jgi:ankyrin repeat protein